MNVNLIDLGQDFTLFFKLNTVGKHFKNMHKTTQRPWTEAYMFFPHVFFNIEMQSFKKMAFMCRERTLGHISVNIRVRGKFPKNIAIFG